MLKYEDLKHVLQGVGDENIERFRGKTVVLFGSSGFLGNWFCDLFACFNERYLNDSCTLICIDRVRGEPRRGAVMWEHDISASMDGLPFGQVDFIINCAGIASPEKYLQLPVETMDVSYTGTRNVLELARLFDVESILLFSSSEVYGTPDPQAIPTPESFIGRIPTRSNRSCYDIGKQVLETLAYIYHEKHSSPVITVRPFNMYGPYMGLNDNRVLANFMKSYISGDTLKVYGDGRQTRTFCYAGDGLIYMLLLLLNGRPGELYNVGNPNPEISMETLVQKFFDAFGEPYNYEVIEYPDTYPADEPERRCPSIDKVKRATGYVPRIGLTEGLRRMYDYCLETEHASAV